jgi:DNA-binding transcriptional LysR family regulator
MELRWLDDFIALAGTRHFSRAAEERNVTQPTLSRRIKLLEDEMGVTLIDRNTLPLSLTPAGKIFLSGAENMSRIARDTKSQCREIRKQVESRLRFATPQTLYLLFYRNWLMPASERHNIPIDLNLNSTSWAASDFVAALTQGQCDLVLCYWHPLINFIQELEGPEFEYLVVCEEELVPVTALGEDNQPLFQLPGSSRNPLPYISYHASSFLRPLVDHSLLKVAQPPDLVTINENMHSVSVKAMIKEGFGVGWLPKRLVSESLTYNSLSLAGDEQWNIPLQIRLYRLKNSHRATLDPFWEKMREELQTDGLIEVQT